VWLLLGLAHAGGRGFFTRPGPLVWPWNIGKVAAGAGVGGCGFSAPQAPLSGRTLDTYMSEVAGGASAHPGSWPTESWLFTPQ